MEVTCGLYLRDKSMSLTPTYSFTIEEIGMGEARWKRVWFAILEGEIAT
jgi:hypothetical protein